MVFGQDMHDIPEHAWFYQTCMILPSMHGIDKHAWSHWTCIVQTWNMHCIHPRHAWSLNGSASKNYYMLWGASLDKIILLAFTYFDPLHCGLIKSFVLVPVRFNAKDKVWCADLHFHFRIFTLVGAGFMFTTALLVTFELHLIVEQHRYCISTPFDSSVREKPGWEGH